ncbi:MAG: hypothetical protein ACPGYT_15570 [Nitrospirales bacterium]
MKSFQAYLFTVILLFVADSGLAECGWVLWMKIDNDPSRTLDQQTWEVRNAAPRHQECLQTADAETSALYDSYTKQLANTHHAELKKGNRYLIITNPGRQVSQRIDFLCLPSSMNPRS